MSITKTSTSPEHMPIVMNSAAAQDDPFFSLDASSLGLMNLEMTSPPADDLGYNWEECDLREDVCMQNMVDSNQGQQLWTMFQSYVVHHESSAQSTENNMVDVAIAQDAPTIEAALGFAPPVLSHDTDMGRVVRGMCYATMIELFPWEEAFYAIEDAADLAKEMGKRGYKLFRKGTDQTIGIMKPKLRNMAKFANKMKNHVQQGWIKIRPAIQPIPGKVANITKNTASVVGPKIGQFASKTKQVVETNTPKVIDGTKTGLQIAKNTTKDHIWPKIIKPTGNLIKNTAKNVKNLTLEHVWPKIVKPSANYLLAGAQILKDSIRDMYQMMPWTKSPYDDIMFYDFYQIEADGNQE